MPCNSDYLAAHDDEVEFSRALQLLDELDGKRKHPDKDAWSGYDSRAYGHCTKAGLDDAVSMLCARLSALPSDAIKDYSPEMQMWWRDHQQADRRREAKERKDAERKAAREVALSKLTAAERKVLGLK
jgi:hypothetical protein